MAIFKQKGRTNSKRHKFHLFKLGGGAKLHKNFAKKFLATSLCAAVVLLGATVAALFSTPAVTSAGTNEPTTFVTSAKANHWGRSDLRKYLNGVEKVDNTLPLDTTASGSNATGYASHFSDAEYALVQPFKYDTNVFVENSQTGTVTSYDTTDRFWLLSGNFSSDQVLSWGATDVSLNSNYTNLTPARVVPVSYWSRGASYYSWLRSPSPSISNIALVALPGSYVYDGDVGNADPSISAAFKLDLSSVIFASAASAAPFAAGEGGSRKFEITGSADFGQKTSSALPDYGMYLKRGADKGVTFAPASMSYAYTAATGSVPVSATLTVNYSGGDAEQYVVVQAFAEDSLTAGTTSYAAARQLSSAGTSSTIDVSSWGLSSLDGYTIKVWMEDASGGSSLAAATEPVTFVGSDGSIKKVTDGSETKNQRVFAMKNDLQTSWGTLANKTDWVGSNPTNQKIYFGTYVDTKDSNKVKPLEFWIAGRETYAAGKSPKDGDGTIDPAGEIMTLYQAKSVETRLFNASTDNYKNVPTLTLKDSQSVEYTGSELRPAFSYEFNGTDIDFTPTVAYQYRVKGSGAAWTEGLPTDAGKYEVRGVAASTDDYETATSAPVTFEITKATPTYTAPPLNATYGDMLSSLTDSLDKPTGVNKTKLEGSWAWVAGDDETVGAVGKHNYTAKFTPTDKTNYDWSAITGWDSTNGCFTVDVTVTVKADTSTWGTAEVRSADGKTQYVDSTGRTSIEVSSENLDGNGILWLHEESDGTGAWYSIDLSTLAFELDKGYRFYVQWLSPHDAEYDTYYSQLDDEQKARVEDDNGWLFLIGVLDQDGNPVQPFSLSDILEKPSSPEDGVLSDDGVVEAYTANVLPSGASSSTVDVYVQIGDDWDLDELQGYYITSGADEEVPVEAVINFPFPEGTDEFGLMHLSHFSPYFIFDELTAEEKAALGRPSTGDISTELLISGLAVVLVASLGVLLVLIIRKKKFED